MIGDFLALFQTDLVLSGFGMLWRFMPIWLPVFLVALWFVLWIDYKRREYINSQGSVLLEIKIPEEMSKSPLAMEMFLNSLHNPVVGNLIKVYYEGAVRVWYSLELVSIDGTVHFFIWAPSKSKNLIETQLYAQFPNIEVHEVPDYTLGIHHDPEKIKFGWFGNIVLTQADPFPIKTYIDYGLDEDPKEEFRNDPLVAVLEFLGSLRKGEQAWIQIMIQAHAKEGLKLGRIITKPDWKDAAKKEIKKIREEATPKEGGFTVLTKGQTDTIAAIERSVSKFAFDTMIRATYFAETEVYNPANIGGLIGSFKQFSSNTMNGLKPGFSAAFEYPWQDFRGRKKLRNERRILEAYKRRSFFNTPFKNLGNKPFILSTEELATLFHFPSRVTAATPTLSRIPSKRAEAPANLPT
jgi:hypothetical protein